MLPNGCGSPTWKRFLNRPRNAPSIEAHEKRIPMGNVRPRYRVGVDIGGTFTDFLVMDRESGAIYPLKIPSTPQPERAIVEGLHEYRARFGLEPEGIEYFSHGTTLALNTLLEHRGAKGGLLTTAGFRDILELRRLRLDQPNNLFAHRPHVLIPRRLVREVRERMRHDGRIAIPIARADVEAAAGALVEQGVETLTVAFLHAHRNDTHERLAKGWIEALFPELYVCTSAEIWPQQREFERTLAAVMNAYVGARMKTYFETLRREVDDLGVSCRIFSTKSNGGVMSVEAAARRPVETLLSGPAAGVIGAAFVGRRMGVKRLVTLDMGGTSADVSVVDGELSYSTENTIGDYPVIMPAVDISAIGAGGGSIAWTDAEGVLKVGPRSAGAVPGPACYGRGGEDATVTDAYLQVGIIRPGAFLGGEMPLAPERAEEALARLGSRLDLDASAAADAVLQVASANIYAALVPQLARRGADGADFALLAYGAAGPTHAFMLARELDFQRVIVPPAPGTLCALGCIAADFRADFVTSVWRDCDGLEDRELRAVFESLEEEAIAWLADQRVDLDEVYLLRSADLCYSGQSYELGVALPVQKTAELGTSRLVDWFNDAYHRAYGFADRDAPVRLIEARVQVVGVTQKPQVRALGPSAATADHAPSRRRIVDRGQEIEASVRQRFTMRPGDRCEGPLVVEQYDTTVYVPEGFQVEIDPHLNLIGTRS